MDLVGFLRDWRRVGKAEVDMEVGAVVEAKEEDEEEEEKKRRRRRRRRTTKSELRKKKSTIAMPGAGLLLLFWGLQRGYPLWTCFLAFFSKGFIRKSAFW